MSGEGLGYVVACYGITAATLALWFAMIVTKLRRQRHLADAPAGAAPSNADDRQGPA